MISFSKIHGLGNDFIVVNELCGEEVPENEKASFAKKHCSRRFSIGADGVLFLQTSEKAGFKMRTFNADGSEAETCVNGLRCAALEKTLMGKRKRLGHSIETLQGIANTVVSLNGKHSAEVEIEFLGKARYIEKNSLEIDGREYGYHFVDVGNPHAVVFLEEDVSGFPVEEVGHKFEYSERFVPARTNTEFVNIVSRTRVKMRVHERGACETQACGSGSIAAVIAGAENNLLEKGSWVKVEQPGGVLGVNYGEKLLLKGAAEKVFEGEVM